MSGQKWTKEPWRATAGNNIIGKTDSIYVAIARTWDLRDGDSGAVRDANRDRIVACVNGSNGLNPEAFAECVEALEASLQHIECNNSEQSGIIDACANAIANARKVTA